MKNRILFLVLICCGNNTFAQIHFFSFIDSVFQRPDIRESNRIKLELINAGYKESDDEAVNTKVRKLVFMHLLLTSNYAWNNDAFGGFRIPYFWNFTAANPRDSILLISNGKKLKQLAPPAGSSFHTMATLERVPVIFWGDFMTDEPKYEWIDSSTFYTFGWCSEREMAFKAWMGISGMAGNIAFKGNHVWMEIEVAGVPDVFFYIDNTFNRFEIKPVSQKTHIDPKDHYLTWYNQNGADKNIQKKLSAMTISSKRADDLLRQIISFFNANSEDH